ncbi:LysR substrate-binding domain-containing protein [Methylobacterium sp. J-092]|uniref:LysR substrate-binding domain-containing protein n=1 Tax=Methylobacterium sp. J-092 TaxID=2836667 RepID=UPI001FBAF57F|nr:LysR substrate-binding domain-containing protein [Methylobacterium sp. J-092]MCJ2010549.1 LysR substrate-binding domain-containing protein [Methylobacterium sp. J-092]
MRINAPVSFGTYSLSPLLPAYMADNPEVTVRLTLSDRVVDLVDEGYDCVFRAGPLHGGSLIARGLRPLNLIPCASPAYLERQGRPRHPGDLTLHACLGFLGSALEERWTFHGDEGEVVVPIGARFSANSGHALRQAALAGMGVIHHAEELLADDLASGRLVRVLPGWRSERPLHILYAPTGASRPSSAHSSTSRRRASDPSKIAHKSPRPSRGVVTWPSSLLADVPRVR